MKKGVGMIKNCIGLIAVATALSCGTGAVAEAPRPNIVLIMVDDMGYSDLGCYGGEINTPNIDRLARNGVRFSRFYNGSRCCPTRASLLTGLHSHLTGIGHMTNRPDKNNNDKGEDFPNYRGFLNRKCVTIAEALKPAGYATLMAGKWHLGYNGQCVVLAKVGWSTRPRKVAGTLRVPSANGSRSEPATFRYEAAAKARVSSGAMSSPSCRSGISCNN